MRKLSKKLLLSILSVALVFIALGTTTFAWFSMNNKVLVTGMTVSTKVSDNLFIAASSASNDKAADSDFKNALNQPVSGVLQPVSTVNGSTFFYTSDAKADGSKDSAITGTGAVPYTALASTPLESPYVGFVDYVFELKAVNASTTTKYINLSTLNLLYMGNNSSDPDQLTHAWRVALFVQEQADTSATLAATTVTDAYSAIATTADRIYAPSGFAYFGSTAVSAVDTKATMSVTVNGSGWSAPVTTGKTLYYKLTVRLWLEGEDTDCFNTKFVDLTNDWILDLGISFDDAQTSAVSVIGSTVRATISGDGTASLTAALSYTGETAKSYQWYKVVNGGTDTLETGATNATFTAGTNNEYYYCVITTVKGNTYYTPVAKFVNA